MDPREETLSLKEFPLPLEGRALVVTPEDSILPTCVKTVENAIEQLEKEKRDLDARLVELYRDRNGLIERAVKFKIMEDDKFKIEEIIKYGNRVCDINKLKESNPEKWKIYKTRVMEKAKQDSEDILQKAKESLETKVLLGIADKVFGKDRVDLYSQTPATISYEVRKK
jgi:hypothetical protein